ncbi:F-box domain protein [Diplocarpon rosae]|nr:F-box domain protein [Diplocarpon rosae]
MSRPSDGEEGMGPLQKGRLRYQQQDFHGAVKAFTEAVDMSSDHLLMTALDARAAAYEKLQQLLPALRDAKRMLELKPKQSKGYLRAGKILQLQGKQELALQIYERGLAKVPSGSDKDRQHLASFHEKLRQMLKPGKSRDFLERLPPELALMVWNFLPIRDRVIGLSVSKRWRGVLEGSKDLWTTFDTTYAKRGISMKSLKIYVRRSKYTLSRAFITLKASMDEQKMKWLTKTCKELRDLHFGGNGPIGESLVSALPGATNIETITISHSTEITLMHAQLILRLCHQSLVEVKFLNVKGSATAYIPNRWPMVKSIKTLHLRTTIDSCLDFNGLRDATPNATSVVLDGWKIAIPFVDATTWTTLEHLDLSNTKITNLPALPPTLKHLALNENPQLKLAASEDRPTLLPLLQSFECHSTALDGNALALILEASIKVGNLQILKVGGRLVNGRPNLVANEFPASESVEELSLASMDIGDRVALEVVGLYPNVKKLDMSSTRITGVAVKAFVQNGVKWLKMNHCESVGVDAVDWARGKGVEVMHNFGGQGVQVRVRPRFADSVFANHL